ncbi:MAG: hypothetical protein ACI9FJ_002345 [Alteromonadaceae bacterium]|jgi:hypothetical protein
MNIKDLIHQLDQQNQHPAVEQWHPPFCGDMPIEIKKDGAWWYMDSPISRMPLVKLFASVLTRQDDQYYLVTPVEKVRIKVEQHPFIITQWQLQSSLQGQVVIFSTNVGDEFILSEQYPLCHGEANGQQPYLTVHRGLQATLHRNVYYQLAEIAHQQNIDGVPHWVITSGTSIFSLGVS